MENLVSLVFTVFLVLALPHRRDNVLVRAAYVYGVDDRDVEGLSNLVDWFSIPSVSFGNPCLEGAQWDWVECSSDDPPRITALNLKSYALVGTIPDFSTMDALETIDIRNNYLKGTIPSFLGNLPNLKELDLAYNELSGPLPSSLTKNNKISLDVTGNTDLCTGSSSNACTNSDTSSSSTDSGESTSEGGQKKKSSKVKLILAIVIPVFIIFWVVLGICFVMRQKKKSADALAAMNAGKQGGNNEPAYGTTTSTAAAPPQDMANGMVMMGQIGQAVNNEYNQMNVVDQTNAQNYHQAQS